MSNDYPLTNSKILPAANGQAVFTQTGEKNTQIAHANNVNQVINIILPMSAHRTGNARNATVSES
ncbi:MAG: hypothetical protein LC101_10680 [Flavobacteriales bacterium]|nr:hypothetical protein [Flavobacteriales bacterium]